MIEAGIHDLLVADATLASLIGVRLYPVVVPETAVYPCMSYQVISTTTDLSFGGTAERQKRMQFDIWSTVSYSQVKTIQQALAAVLEGYQGTLSDGTSIIGTFSGIDQDLYEGDSRTYRVLSEYIFHYVD